MGKYFTSIFILKPERDVFLMKPDKKLFKDRKVLQQALDFFTLKAKDKPDSYIPYLNRGFIFFLSGEYKKALLDCERAAQLDGDNVSVLCMQGLVLGKLNQNLKALACFERSMKIDPNFYFAYIGKALIERNLGKYKGALKDLDSAAKLSPKSFRIYLYRGDIKVEMGEFEAAVKDYQRAIKHAPTLKRVILDLIVHAYIQGGIYNAENGDYKTAVKLFKSYIELVPDDPNAYYHLGDAYMNLEQFDEARKCLEKAAELDPKGSIGDEARDLLDIFDQIAENDID